MKITYKHEAIAFSAISNLYGSDELTKIEDRSCFVKAQESSLDSDGEKLEIRYENRERQVKLIIVEEDPFMDQAWLSIEIDGIVERHTRVELKEFVEKGYDLYITHLKERLPE